jgi:hypothetical protein
VFFSKESLLLAHEKNFFASSWIESHIPKEKRRAVRDQAGNFQTDVQISQYSYERRSILITTNLVFSAWERIFKDPMTTLAAVDRVVHHAVILDMADISSFRATQARADQAQASSDPPSS